MCRGRLATSSHGTYHLKGRNIILSMTRLRDGVVPPKKIRTKLQGRDELLPK